MNKKQIRSANKAVILQDRKLLVLKKKDESGFFYTLPGGGQEHGETAEEGLIRECAEEINVTVKPVRLLFVRDYIAENHDVKDDILQGIHQLELMFLCEITEGIPENGNLKDNGQLSVDWIPLDKLDGFRIYPSALKLYLKEYETINHTIYLGDVN